MGILLGKLAQEKYELLSQNTTIVNDNSVVMGKRCSNLWYHFLTNLEVSFMLQRPVC
jgi:hypothetical protein